jgi:hypothetical protein
MFFNNVKLLIFLFLLVVIGVGLDYFTQGSFIPKDFTYTVGAVERTISESYSGDIYRASGWQRTQLESSLLLFFLYYLILISQMGKTRYLSLLFYIVTFISLLFCFNKTVIVAFFLLGVLHFFNYKFILKSIIFIMLIISSCLPFYLKDKVGSFDYKNSSLEEAIIFASFYDRVNNAWSSSIDNAQKYNEGVFGSGIGGIGVGYNEFNNSSNPIDNGPLYVFGTFGYIGLFLFNIYFIYILFYLKNKIFLIFVASISTIFLTVNIFEIKFFVLFFIIVWIAANKTVFIRSLE